MPRKRKEQPENYNKAFPAAMRKLMDQERITQGELAAYLGKSRQAVSYYCDGSSSPDWETVAMIADFFNVSTDYLLGRTPNKTNDATVQAMVKYTGLSETSILRLGLAKQYAAAILISDIRRLAKNEDIGILQDKLLELCKYGRMNDTKIGIAGSCASFIDLIDDLINAASRNELIPSAYNSLMSAATSEFETTNDLPVEIENELYSKGIRVLTNNDAIRFEAGEVAKEINSYLIEKYLIKQQLDESGQ